MPLAARFAVAAIALLLAAFPAGALAADASVTIAGKAFGPGDVTVSPGDSVTWNWGEGPHNVHVVDGPVTFDSGVKDAGGTYTRALTAPGIYRYQCDVHPSMRGVITVAGATAGPAGPAGAAAPALRAITVSKLAVVRVTASGAGTLSISLLRAGRVVRRSSAALAPGANRVALSVRGLRTGRYRVRLQTLDGAGRRSAPVLRAVLVSRAALLRKARPATPAPAAAQAPAQAAPAPAADDHGGRHGGRSEGASATPPGA